MSKRFLIGQLARFGDCLYATTIAKQIKQDFPQSHLTWAIASKYKSVLDLNPHVDEIWEIDADDKDYDNIGWEKFETKALERKEKGDFDEVIFSQISPTNWINFNGTIRGTILSSYKNPIKVSVEPVLKLSEQEVDNVKNFAESYNLKQFEHVILFEFSPGSYQSEVNFEFALSVAEEIIKDDSSVCFILSSAQKLNNINHQIIDASELTFRENAALINLCTMLVGCSSGLSWISTSEASKRIPTLQLLDEKFFIYAGMDYEFEINHLDNSHIVEMLKFDKDKTIKCIKSIIQFGITTTKSKFHQKYKPNYNHLKNLTTGLIASKQKLSRIIKFIENFVVANSLCGNQISPKYMLLIPYTHIYGFYYRYIKATESGMFFYLRNFFKSIL